MDLGLSGRRALVTAASEGLGLACAEQLAQEGAFTFLASRDERRVADAAARIGGRGSTACDMRDADAIPDLVEQAVTTLGGLDVLVVNCGPPRTLPFFEASDDDWDQAHEGVVMSAVRLIREAAPHLRASECGRIVILSAYGLREPTTKLVISQAARAAVAVMAKVVAGELAPSGVTVNSIAAGPILTNRLRTLQAEEAEAAGVSMDEQLERYATRVPVGRVGRPADIAGLCAFLCSTDAGFITGQTIVVDGGINRAV